MANVDPQAIPGYGGKKTITPIATVGNTAVELVAVNGRRSACEIQNLGTTDLWLGVDNTVDATNGYKLGAGLSYYDPHSVDAWWGYQATSAGDVRVIEVTH